MSEKVLGIVWARRHFNEFREVLIITSNRVIVASLGKVWKPTNTDNFFSTATTSEEALVEFGLEPIKGVGRGLALKEKSGKDMSLEELLALAEVDPEKFLKAHKDSYDIPNSEITKVEVKKHRKGGFFSPRRYYGVKLTIFTLDRSYVWYDRGSDVIDCENKLRPIFGDKLFIEK